MRSSKSVDELLLDLPRAEAVIVKHLRTLITTCIPKASEHMYDDVDIPFYRHNKLICFIKPASVSWGSNHANNRGTALGFNQGFLMSDQDGVLLAEGRKQVYMMYFKSLKDLDENQVRPLLFEAALIDEQFAKKKNKKPSVN